MHKVTEQTSKAQFRLSTGAQGQEKGHDGDRFLVPNVVERVSSVVQLSVDDWT